MIGKYRVKSEISWVISREEAQDGRLASLFVRNRESTMDRVEKIDAEDMYDIVPNGIPSIDWHSVVKTADVPLCFAPTVDVEIIVASGRCPIPFGF